MFICYIIYTFLLWVGVSYYTVRNYRTPDQWEKFLQRKYGEINTNNCIYLDHPWYNYINVQVWYARPITLDEYDRLYCNKKCYTHTYTYPNYTPFLFTSKDKVYMCMESIMIGTLNLLGMD